MLRVLFLFVPLLLLVNVALVILMKSNIVSQVGPPVETPGLRPEIKI